MNDLEIELTIKRLEKPVENLDKVVESIPRARKLGLWRHPKLARAVYELVWRIYDEVLKNPRKAKVFRNKPLDVIKLSGLPPFPLLRDSRYSTIEESKLYSYIMLRRHGFEVKQRSYILLVTTVLTPKVLGPILKSKLTQEEKLRKIDDYLDRELPLWANAKIVVAGENGEEGGT